MCVFGVKHENGMEKAWRNKNNRILTCIDDELVVREACYNWKNGFLTCVSVIVQLKICEKQFVAYEDSLERQDNRGL